MPPRELRRVLHLASSKPTSRTRTTRWPCRLDCDNQNTSGPYHGGHAAAGRPERLFRDVKFPNNVLQQRMKPETISRAAMLRESPDCYKVAPEVIVGLYNKAHKKSKKRGAQTPAPETDE